MALLQSFLEKNESISEIICLSLTIAFSIESFLIALKDTHFLRNTELKAILFYLRNLNRIHLTDSFFVVRAKTNLKYKTVKWKRRMPKNIMTDAEVKLTGYLSEKKYPESFRLVRYYDEEDDREFTFLTNAKQLSALDVADLYKKRWLIELFFKWLKQHLKIKKFWGTTENAVRIQISVAIITYCLVAIVQHDMKLKRSTYEVLQILSISLTDKTHLRDLFDKTNFNDVKDLNDPLIPGLFD